MATIPVSLECSKDAAFVMDPNENKRVGYLTSLTLGGFKLAADLNVCVPFNDDSESVHIQVTPANEAMPAATAKVVAVLEKFDWNGGVGDPLKLEAFVSAENAQAIKSQIASGAGSAKVSLGWWIADYDQEIQKWFEQSHPVGATQVSGLVAGRDVPELDVDLNPVSAKDGIDVNVYKVTIAIAPATNQSFSIHFANSADKKVVKTWGFEVGALAQNL